MPQPATPTPSGAPRVPPKAAVTAPRTPRPAPTPWSDRLGRAFHLTPGPGNPWPLFALNVRSTLASRKTLFLLLFLLVPVYVTLIIHGSVGMDEYEENSYWGGPTPDASRGLLWFQDGTFGILFPFLVPLVVAVFATGTIGEEVEGKTLPYLFTRPVYRNWVLLAKAGAVYVSVLVLVLMALTIFWFTSVSLTENPFTHSGQLWGYYGVAALSVFAALGVYLFLGVLWRRAIVLILLYIFLFEFVFSNIPALFFKRASMVNYIRPILLDITDRTMSQDDIRIGFLDAGPAAAVLVVIGLAGLLGALFVVSTKDYNV